MRKVLAPLFVGIILATILASCGSAQHGHCEAYGLGVNNTPSELPTTP